MAIAMREHACRAHRCLAAAVLLCAVIWGSAPQGALAEGAPTASGGSTVAAVSFEPGDGDGVSISEEGGEGILADNSYGITSFTRYNKGTNRAYDGSYYGYRWPMAAADAFAVVVTEKGLLVYIPESAEQKIGADIHGAAGANAFLEMLAAMDAANADGGRLFSETSASVAYVTSDDEVAWGDYTYRFGVEIEEEHYCATSTLRNSEDGSGGGLYELTGMLTPASEMSIAAAPTGLAWLARFFSRLDWSPLWVSLRTTLTGTVIIFIIGLLAAWGTIKTSERVKGVLDTVFTIPMVLPPTVCGFLLLLFFGKSTGIGRWFIAHGLDIVFTWPAAVIACVVVGFPLMYRTARGAFENLEPAMLDAARTLGWSEPRIFRKLMLPLAWPSIAAGTVLAFARAMGEFGATLFFAGNFAGITQTMPLAIYFYWMGGKSDVAIFWVIVVILFSFLVILFINIYTAHVQKYRAAGGRKARGQAQEPAADGADFSIDSEAAKRLGFGQGAERIAGNQREGES